MKKTIYLLRHGQTKGNLEGRYIGRTDEDLCDQGVQAVNKLKNNLKSKSELTADECSLFVSPMKRCRQTAEILFPGKEQNIIEGFREMDFGDFEYKNYQELNGNEEYQRYIDSGGKTDFPGAEKQEEFRERCVQAFRSCIEDVYYAYMNNKDGVCLEKMYGAEIPDNLVFVVHGGTIMSVLAEFTEKSDSRYRDTECCSASANGYDHYMVELEEDIKKDTYFTWQTKPASGYRCILDYDPDHKQIILTEIERCC